MDRFTILHHVVSALSMEADPSKIKAITEMPTPKDVADVRRFWAQLTMWEVFAPYR
jgi:hypothetical protein